MFDSQYMARVASSLVTRVTFVTATGAGLREVLPPNPRRWWVAFRFLGAFGGNPNVIPITGDQFLSVATSVQFEQVYKWHDCPSVVVGGWAWFDAAADDLTIVECLYTGD